MRTVTVVTLKSEAETSCSDTRRVFQPDAYAVVIEDDSDNESIAERAKKLDAMEIRADWLISGVDLIAIKSKGDAQRFSEVVTLVKETADCRLV